MVIVVGGGRVECPVECPIAIGGLLVGVGELVRWLDLDLVLLG